PDGLAVVSPIEPEGPARQALARIPFALAVMQQAGGRVTIAQTANERVGVIALRRSDGRSVPLVRLEVVDRDEGRLAAHGEAHVLLIEVGIHRFAEPIEPRPGL